MRREKVLEIVQFSSAGGGVWAVALRGTPRVMLHQEVGLEKAEEWARSSLAVSGGGRMVVISNNGSRREVVVEGV